MLVLSFVLLLGSMPAALERQGPKNSRGPACDRRGSEWLAR